MKTMRWLMIACVALSFLFVLMQPTLAQAVNQPLRVETHKVKSGIFVAIEANHAPQPGGIAILQARITPLYEAPNLRVRWAAPLGGIILGDSALDLGPVKARETVTLEQQVRFPQAGFFPVIVEGYYTPDPAIAYSNAATLFIGVDRFLPRLSDVDLAPTNSHGAQTVVQSSVEPMPAGNQNADGEPCFVVKGTLQRLDGPIHLENIGGYLYSAIGPMEYRPIRYTMVEIREWDPIDDDSYGYVLTNSAGYFEKSFCDDDGTNDTLEIYIRVRAEVRDPAEPGREVGQVVDTSWIDEVYEFETAYQSSGGGTVTINLNYGWHESWIFNIADAVYNAYDFWNVSGGEANGDPRFDFPAEVHWEYQYGEDETFYNGFFGEITLADFGDLAPLDDGVIMHEWTHMADDHYSCQENPGGDHSFGENLGDAEFGWGEGYPDFYPSAVRQWLGDPYSQYYIDLNNTAYGADEVGETGFGGFFINLEDFPNYESQRRSSNWEATVAATLWDLIDHHDELYYDHYDTTYDRVQYIFSSDEFAYNSESSDIFDAQCDAYTFFAEWGRQYDLYHTPNISLSQIIHSNLGFNAPWLGHAPDPLTPSGRLTGGGGEDGDWDWWDRVVYVVDNSPSMAGTRFEAVRTVLNETVLDATAAGGAEFNLYTFNHDDANSALVVAGAFSPSEIQPAISALATGGSENPAYKPETLRALGQAIEHAYHGQAWAFTDGTPDDTPSVEDISRLLQEHDMRASIALLAGGGSAPQPGDEDPTAQPSHSVNALRGAVRRLLGPALADSIDANLLAYLYTANNSGGQFLYVSQDQLDDASDVLLAQLTHSAGAGRWSDYVSTTPTYRWNNLPSWQYQWVDASTTGTNLGTPPEGGYVELNLWPITFPFFEFPEYYWYIWGDGYITLYPSNNSGSHINTHIPSLAPPNNAIYPYWDSLLNSPPGKPEEGLTTDVPGLLTPTSGQIWTLTVGDWRVFQWKNFYNQWGAMDFETKVNHSTGEIQFLYNSLTHGAESATIGVEDWYGTTGVEIVYENASRPTNGKGFQLFPVPAKPTASYQVMVDPTMSSIGFLATTYSGDLNWMAVTDAFGNPVNCVGGVVCIDTGMVQYMQVEVGNAYGPWTVTFSPGKDTQATFSFSSFATSSVEAGAPGEHERSAVAAPFLVEMGRTTDDGTLTGQLRRADGGSFGSSFILYDDGNHGDGMKFDGVFASGPYTPPDLGTTYLWLEGMIDGYLFRRVDPRPYIFSPLALEFDDHNLANMGGYTQVDYTLHNYSGYRLCVNFTLAMPVGWHGITPEGTCLDGGTMQSGDLLVYMAPGTTNNLPSGNSGQITLTAVEAELGEFSASDEARITRHRQPAVVKIDNLYEYLRPGGDLARLRVFASDEQGYPVADGTRLWITPTLGTTPPFTTTVHGRAFFNYISGSIIGTEYLQVGDAHGHRDYTTLDIKGAEVGRIVLEAKKKSLRANGTDTSVIHAYVFDDWGQPMPNQKVRISVNGDLNKWGSLNPMSMPGGSEVITGTTDVNGMFTVQYVAGLKPGTALLTAELIPQAQQGTVPQNGSVRATEEIVLWLYRALLPLILKK